MLGIAPQDVCGPVIDLLQKIAGPTSQAWLKELRKFLRKEETWSRIIHIDRSRPFDGTDIMKDVQHQGPLLEGAVLLNSIVELLHPEYENSGPNEFNMDKIHFWTWHDTPPGEEARCNRLYMRKSSDGQSWEVSLEGLHEYLCLDGGTIQSRCLGLRDAKAMIDCLEYIPTALKGIEINLWKGLAKSTVNGKLFLPYLYVFVSKKAQRPYKIGWRQVTDVSLPVHQAKNLVALYS